MENVRFASLEKITASFIGDSLFGGHGIGKENTWIALLSNKYGMNSNNYGINGCTLSACEGGAYPIINRYFEIADNDPDLIVFEGGRNDYNKNAALGDITSEDVTTYKGAIASLIKGLRAKYPRAKLAAVSFWKVGPRPNDIGIECGVYTDAMKEVCDALGVNFIDTRVEEESLVRMTDPEFRAKYCWVGGDVCHLNVEGMKLVMPFFERKLAQIME